jgi:HPP family
VAIARILTDSASDAYLLAPLACALASAAMTLTGTLHPPGGATAVLAVADPGLRAIGWNLVPLVVIACLVMISVACIMGNLLRRYPVYWWTTGKCGSRWKTNPTNKPVDVENTQPEVTETINEDECSVITGSNYEKKDRSLHEDLVLVSCHGVLYPPDLDLGEEELAVLESLVARLGVRSPRE